MPAAPQRNGFSGLIETVWPRFSSNDSESQRRKKLAVRTGHLAMAAMIVAGAAGSIIVDFRQLPGSHLSALAVLALAYIGWSLYGTHGAVRSLLWEGNTSHPFSARLPCWGAMPYFSIQIVLAGLVYYLGDQGHIPNLVWLALLPPVALSVFLLERPGIAVVSSLMLGISVLNVVRWHGWRGAPYGLLAFSFAVLFTLVFTLLIASSEKSRSQVQRLAGELSEANLKLREYAVQAEELAVTRERNRLAREIHDSLGHYLTVVNVQLQAAQALQESDPLRSRKAMEMAQALTQDGLRDIRRSVAALRASPLHDRVLEEAVREMLAEGGTAGLKTEMRVLGNARPLAPQAALTLYRAGQEGLTNVRKHARATRATLVLDFQASTQVTLNVTDDGVGASPDNAAATGFGLLGLRERVQLLGGGVRVRTAPGAGFALEVAVPG